MAPVYPAPGQIGPELAGIVSRLRRAALATLPPRNQAALRDAAPALRDLTASIDALAD